MNLRQAFPVFIIPVFIILGMAPAVAVAGTLLFDDFEDNDISDWTNLPIASNWIDVLGRGDDGLIPAVSGGQVMGTVYGYHHGRWMIKELPGSAEISAVSFAAMAGNQAIGQTSIILADESWAGNGTRLSGYEINVFGEDARQLWIVLYNGTNPSIRVATYDLGSTALLMNEYEVTRDDLGSWTVLQNGGILTPVSAISDLTYTSFSHVAINVGTPADRVDYIAVSGATAVPLPAGMWAGLMLLGGLGASRVVRHRRYRRI